MENSVGFVYIIRDINGKLYVGSTNDITRRVKEHRRKHSNSKFTAAFINPKLIYFEKFKTLTEARLYEKQIKRSSFERERFYERAGVIQ